MKKQHQLEAQLQHDFDSGAIRLRDGLEIGDIKVPLFVTTRELADLTVFSREGRHLYQVLVNLVFRETGMHPLPDTMASRLLLDRKAVETDYVQKGLANQRIAVVEDDGDAMAIEFELPDDDQGRIETTGQKLIPRITTITDAETSVR